MRTESLESVLFSIFTDSPYSNFRLPEHMWAVVEALNRVLLSTKPLIYWKVCRARNEHKCSNGGRLIKPREQYYLSPNGKKIRVCVRCEAQLWREEPQWLYWRTRTANKDHECTQGCAIKPGEVYFIWDGGISYGIKMCVTCMAKELYLKNVDTLPAYRYTGWDQEHQRPARVEKINLFSGMLPSYWFGYERAAHELDTRLRTS